MDKKLVDGIFDELLFWFGLYAEFLCWSILVSVIAWDFLLNGVVRGFTEFGIGTWGGVALITAGIVKLLGVLGQMRFNK